MKQFIFISLAFVSSCGAYRSHATTISPFETWTSDKVCLEFQKVFKENTDVNKTYSEKRENLERALKSEIHLRGIFERCEDLWYR